MKWLILILLAVTLFLTDGKQVYLPTCNIITYHVVKDKDDKEVPMLFFGYMSKENIETLGRCPLDKLKGMYIGERDEQVIYK